MSGANAFRSWNALVLALAGVLAGSIAWVQAQSRAAVNHIDQDDIGGS